MLNKQVFRRRTSEIVRNEVGGRKGLAVSFVTRPEKSWACGPPKVNAKRLGPATTLYSTVTLSFVIPKRSRPVPACRGGICSSLHWPLISMEILLPPFHPDRSEAERRDLRSASTLAPIQREHPHPARFFTSSRIHRDTHQSVPKRVILPKPTLSASEWDQSCYEPGNPDRRR